jgi:hypothetical protein
VFVDFTFTFSDTITVHARLASQIVLIGLQSALEKPEGEM